MYYKGFPALLLAAVLTAGSSAHAATLVENFANVPGLTGSGWVLTNNSTPGGSTWFQGNALVFGSYEGAVNEYVGANYLAGGSPGSISLWLISPTLNFSSGDVLRFFTRTAPPDGFAYPDSLEVRLSSNGASTDVGATTTSVGDFTTLLVSINPGFSVGGYPEDWTEYSLLIPTAGSGRFAFRYVVDDVAVNGNYIGIDSVSVGGSDIPEPSTMALSLVAGAALLAYRRLHK